MEPDDGTSLLDVMAGGDRDVARCEWEVDATRSGIDLDLRTVRSRGHRLSVDLISRVGELYDLDEDPHEMINLWDDADAASARDALMAQIAEHRPGMIPPSPRVGWH